MIMWAGGRVPGGRAYTGPRPGLISPSERCPSRAWPAGEKVTTGPTDRASAGATGHGSIPGSARRLDMRS